MYPRVRAHTAPARVAGSRWKTGNIYVCVCIDAPLYFARGFNNRPGNRPNESKKQDKARIYTVRSIPSSGDRKLVNKLTETADEIAAVVFRARV